MKAKENSQPPANGSSYPLFCFFCYCLLLPTVAFSQGTAINTTGTAAASSSILDVTSSDKGVLIPRMTTAQRDAITSPAAGLLIFNTDCIEFQYYNSTTWISMINANSGTSPVSTAATNLQATSFSANWNSVIGASTYYLDVSTTSDFSSFVTGYNNLNVGNVVTYSVTGLTCNTAYYYRVRAGSSCGAGSNSNAITATTSACFSCGSPFTDTRDSKSYNTVQIGTQCWMAQNLSYNQSSFGNDWCYDNDCPTYETTYGRLYDWAAVMQGASATNANPSGVQGVCPSGWHVPSSAEQTVLRSFLGANDGGQMKETGTVHWTTPNTGATNSSGFTGLPAGMVEASIFYDIGTWARFWSTAVIGVPTEAQTFYLTYNSATSGSSSYQKVDGFSLRCVKD